MVKWIFIGLTALPVAEIGVFILVGSSIGFAWAFLLLVATSVAGLVALRMAGQGRFALFRSVATNDGVAGVEARLEANPHAFLVIIAGILLVLPGFITGAIGALLLLPPIRNWCGRRFGAAGRRSGEAVIDLSESEWRHVPEGKLEDRRGPSDR
jgi:UPF0716 protein FxsA